MDLQTVIFIGRSGCGKGTQANLLTEYLRAHDPRKRTVYHLETGTHFRKFIEGKGHSNRLSYEAYLRGELQPSFLAVYLWVKALVDEWNGTEHLIIDGTPRYLDEARVLTTAMRFYRLNPVAVHLAVPRAFSEHHLRLRGRADDTETDIKKRLDWFETSVLPAIDYLRDEGTFRFIEIKGDDPIEMVHQNVISKIFI